MQPFSTTLFWDWDPTTLDPEKHSRYIIGRVLTRGTMDEWQHLKSKRHSLGEWFFKPL